jgi:sulfur dioxygenase
MQLHKAGFADVANLAGGMLRWQAERLPVEGAEVEG